MYVCVYVSACASVLQANEWAAASGMQFFECSARESTNVEQAFTAVARLAMAQYEAHQAALESEEVAYTVDLNAPGAEQGGGEKSGGGCAC